MNHVSHREPTSGRDSTKGRHKLLSFFTGAGFLDIGFALEGFDALWHNEYDPAFVTGFQHAMAKAPSSLAGSKRIESGESIVDIGPNAIARKAFGDAKLREGFGMIGGPPCPDFSVGGKNRGSTGENGRLTETYVDRIVELRPDFFVLENVPGLIRTRKHRAFFDSVTSKLEREYLYSWEVLNALDFGVPQDRQRVIVVGFRRALLKTVYGKESSRIPSAQWSLQIAASATHPSALTKYQWPDARSGSQWKVPEGHPKELTVGYAFSRHGGKLPSELANGGDIFQPKSDKFKWILEGDDSKKSFKRLHRHKYSPAAAYGNNEVHVHPEEPRRISVREAMRIQTVPDWYQLPEEMTLTKKFKTVGNGVPVRLAQSVARTIREVLEGERTITR